jgi:hypothetical protein
MKDRTFNQRVIAEETLGPEELALLDARLASSEAVRDVLSAMPQDEPSLAWRSALNERLRVAAPRRRLRVRLMPYAAGGLVAASMVLVALSVLTPPPAAAPDVTDAVIAAHAQTTSALAMGQALTIEDRPIPDDEFHWTEDDLGAL